MTDTANKQALELELLRMWAEFGFKEIYKYKHRVKAYREPLTNIELFYDVTCGGLFKDVKDLANYNDAFTEECKVSIEDLIRNRQTICRPDNIMSSGWMPVAKRPDAQHRWFLASDGHGIGFGLWQDGKWYAANAAPFSNEDITHYMPTPQPPIINSTEDDHPGPSISSTRLMLSSTEEEETDAETP